MLKSDLRVKHLNIRKNMSVEKLDCCSTLIYNRLIEFAKEYKHIGVYVSLRHEVDTRKFIQWCFNQHKHVYVPKIVRNEMIFVEIDSLSDCIQNKMGILEPCSNVESNHSIELMVIPMLAYNERNYRLGYGKAFYDRYLSQHDAYKLGICFSANFDHELQEEDHDIDLTQILTEIN